MSSRRKRKRPLPDWVGESYSSSKRSEDEEEAATSGAAEQKQQSPSADSGSYIGAKNNPRCTHQTRGGKCFTGARASNKPSKDEPLSAEEVIRMSLPLLKFEGSLIYSYNRSECSVLCEDLLSSLSPEDVWHVGLDMEWPVDYQPGATKKVALIQVCTAQDKCYLFHIAPMGALPKALKNLLSHSQIFKYGINIESDFWKLERDFDIQVRPIIRESVKDLGTLANIKLKSAERWTLDGLTRNVLRKRLDKVETVRCGRWDSCPLSEEQIQYAACDAYASYLLANHLKDK
ncbi:bifunctional 3'-5' exonuclease/ATP-dependent helicase WRN-like [Babylonia areolata]|uniref:bifunctional 3'-5' exonuclease/ATP-dependent helicase WRN-like n=1 Tax=Babylonia areolata TaxID=304850 RepID=UPI003FD2E124